MTGIEYMNTVCPTTSAGREPNREDVVDAFEDGIVEGYKLQWKPSEEQMGALASAINYLTEHTCTPGNPLLISLYTNLQKLL